MKRLVVFHVITFVVLANSSVFGDSTDDYWPTWRGPNLNGVSPKGNPPVKWSETENIKWKVKLEGDESNSSPVIWGNKIFFQTATKTDKQGKPEAPSANEGGGRRRGPGGSPPTNIYKFNMVCLDRNSGKEFWQKTAREVLPHQGHHRDHGFVSFSPVTDGKLIWANFGSRGLYCFDTDGNMKWSKDLGRMDTVMGFGEGGSLAVAGDAVIVVRDHQEESFIIALNKETGETIWRKDRDEGTSWATPLPVEVNGKTQVVVSATNLIRSYDLASGEIIWQCSGQTRNVIPTPVAGFGMVYCTSGFRGSALQAIELGRTGDLSGTDAIKWQKKEATPYLYDGRIFVCDVNKEVISSYDAETGESHFVKQKMDEMKGVYASPAAAAGRIYFVGRNGVSYVLKSSDKFEVLAVNILDDKIDCSPAFIGDELYLK
ncbi:MAG: outer membrane protein assembly factor BamB family protein [Planctomycetota bacterium]|jgi:outer membrane protein assembly factor BamB